jgi:hypothetical protein
MRRETREKMDQADIKMENRWKVSPPKRKQKKKSSCSEINSFH